MDRELDINKPSTDRKRAMARKRKSAKETAPEEAVPKKPEITMGDFRVVKEKMGDDVGIRIIRKVKNDLEDGIDREFDFFTVYANGEVRISFAALEANIGEMM